jgi:hypothetical protein
LHINILNEVYAEEDHHTISTEGGCMKRFIAGTAVFIMLVWSTSIGQELSIGPTAGALFTQGSRGYASGMHGKGVGTSYSIGGEVVYSMASVPLDFIGQVYYAPMGGGYHGRDSLVTADGHEGHRGSRSSLFSLGLGGRWVPLRGPVSPYLGVSFLLSHQEGPGHRRDSTQTSMGLVGNPETHGEVGEFEGRSGATRFGVGLSVGSQFALSSLIRLDVGASYSLNSPFRRGGNLSTIGFGTSVLFTIF